MPGRMMAILAAALVLLVGRAGGAAECDVALSFVDFGRVDFRDGAEVSGEVAVSCDRPTRFRLALSPGHGSYRARRLRGPRGAQLRYNVYLDPAHRRVWGDGTASGTSVLAGRSDGRRDAVFAVYGVIPPGQSGPPGAYTDALTVMVER